MSKTIMTDVHFWMLVELDETLKKEFGNVYPIFVFYDGSTLTGTVRIEGYASDIKVYNRAVEILTKLYCK